MESVITIKATAKEMDKFFDKNDVCSVRYCKAKGNGKFDARIRHGERNHYLSGTYTIPEIITELQENKGEL